jgi:methylmalonyl-CoA mutase, C-terminal domain
MSERILIGKVGLDGHDRGVKVVARILRDAGFEVIYTALDEDVDLVGLSMLSGAHMTLAPAVVDAMRAAGCNAPVVVGGIIPPQHIERLQAAGVAAVLTPGAPADQVVAVIRGVLDAAGAPH